MTPSERYVDNLCKKSFLPFWSFPNPLGKKGKELCDVLVVCGHTIILISVKEKPRFFKKASAYIVINLL